MSDKEQRHVNEAFAVVLFCLLVIVAVTALEIFNNPRVSRIAVLEARVEALEEHQ